MPVLNLLLALFVGISTGAGILVAQFFGARNQEGLSKTVGNCITVTAIASIVIMIVGPLITGPLLRAVGTLPSMYEGCRDYLNIFFIGIAGFFYYNILAGVLRGLGDSLSALGFLLIIIFITAIANIGNLSFRLPNMELLDEIGGAVLGFAKGLLYCILLSWVLSFLGLIIGKDTLEHTTLARFFLAFRFLTSGLL